MATTPDDPFALTATEKRMIMENSIERVINTSIDLADHVKTYYKQEHIREAADTNYQDWNELKWLTRKLWERERNSIFKEEQAANVKAKDAGPSSTSRP